MAKYEFVQARTDEHAEMMAQLWFETQSTIEECTHGPRDPSFNDAMAIQFKLQDQADPAKSPLIQRRRDHRRQNYFPSYVVTVSGLHPKVAHPFVQQEAGTYRKMIRDEERKGNEVHLLLKEGEAKAVVTLCKENGQCTIKNIQMATDDVCKKAEEFVDILNRKSARKSGLQQGGKVVPMYETLPHAQVL